MAAPANRLRLVQAYLIGEPGEHEQRMEPDIARCRGHRTQQYEYADPRKIFESQRLQMGLTLYQGVDHIERFRQRHKARATQPR